MACEKPVTMRKKNQMVCVRKAVRGLVTPGGGGKWVSATVSPMSISMSRAARP